MPDEPKQASSGPESGLMRYECQVRNILDPTKLYTVTVSAKGMDELVEKLHRDNYVLISAKTVTKSEGRFELFKKSLGFKELHSSVPPDVKGKLRGLKAFYLFSHVSIRELISLATQLSALLHSGIPLLKALQISQRGTHNRYLKAVLEQAIQSVSSGFTFSHAISRFPSVFPAIWLNLVEVGESSGNLPKVLTEIAAHQEAAQRVKSKVISALFYPSILLLFATGAITFLLLKIIPQFEEMFRGLQISLPLVTQVVITVSHVLRNYFPFVVAGILILAIGIAVAIRTKGGRYLFDFVRMKAPIMGTLVREAGIVRFSRSFATMLRAGVPILQVLEISGRFIGNAVIEGAVSEVREAVRQGKNLGSQLESKDVFPIFMTQLISVGEETGQLDRFFDLVANYYEERIDHFLTRLTTLIEPVLLIFVGAMIGTVAVAMILPIVEISTSVR